MPYRIGWSHFKVKQTGIRWKNNGKADLPKMQTLVAKMLVKKFRGEFATESKYQWQICTLTQLSMVQALNVPG